MSLATLRFRPRSRDEARIVLHSTSSPTKFFPEIQSIYNGKCDPNYNVSHYGSEGKAAGARTMGSNEKYNAQNNENNAQNNENSRKSGRVTKVRL
jgi:hypothetical protein